MKALTKILDLIFFPTVGNEESYIKSLWYGKYFWGFLSIFITFQMEHAKDINSFIFMILIWWFFTSQLYQFLRVEGVVKNREKGSPTR